MQERASNALKLEGSECGAEYKGHWSLFIYYIILSSEQGRDTVDRQRVVGYLAKKEN
jgi:hypothetical protein